MNKGGFSLARLLGISSLKSKVSKEIGIPLTKSGRDAKLGRLVQDLLGDILGTSPEKKEENKD